MKNKIKARICKDLSIARFGYFVRLENSWDYDRYCFTLWGAKRKAKKLLRREKLEGDKIIMEIELK